MSIAPFACSGCGRLRWVVPVGVLFLVLASRICAGVYLTKYTFATNDFPMVYTNESLPTPYKLRVKIMGVPGYGDGFHAANSFNNNWCEIYPLPPPGTYYADLYWLKYAPDYSTLLEIGPMTGVTITILPGDTTPPSVPAGLSVSNITPTGFSVAWNPSWDDTAVWGYQVFRNGTSVGWSPNPSMAVSGVSPATTYQITVQAGDTRGNWSAQSAPLAVTTMSDTSSPTIPANLVVTNLLANSLTLSWSPSTDNVGVTAYEVFQNGSSIGSFTTTTVNVSGLSANTAYAFSVRSRDGVGNWSSLSAALSTTTPPPDTTAPNAPTNVTSTAVGGRTVTLSWSGATDNVGVTGYEIYRDDESIGVVGAITTYTVAGLSPLTIYRFSVRARDAAGNWSAPSTKYTVRTWQNLVSAFGAIYASDNYDENGNYVDTSSSSDWYGYNWYNVSPPLGSGTVRATFTSSDSLQAQLYLSTIGCISLSPGQSQTFTVPIGWAGYANVTGRSDGDYGSYGLQIDFKPNNVPPVAGIVASPLVGRAPLTVTFSGSSSADSDGPLTSYAWDFDNDGSVDARGMTVDTTYQNSGTSPLTFVAKLTVTDFDGASASTTRSITVYPAGSPSVTVQSGATSAPYQLSGGMVTLTADTNGQSFMNWTLVSGSGSFANANASSTTFAATSADAVVKANYVQDPTIIVQPASRSVGLGQPATLTVAATGNSALSYQWRKNGIAIAGGTGPSLTISATQLSDSGTYSVVVSDVAGAITSSAATLSITTQMRMALQYWRANDYPNYPIGGHYEDQEVWVEGRWDWYGEINWDVWATSYPTSHYDPDGNEWQIDYGYDPITWVWTDGHYEWQSVWVTEYAADGQYGSRWDTTSGTYNFADSSSMYTAATANRGCLLASYATNSQITVRAYGNTCDGGSYRYMIYVYQPSGYLYTSTGWFYDSTSGQQLGFAPWVSGFWRIDIMAYYTGTGSLAGVVSYYVPVGVALPSGPPVITSQPSPTFRLANLGTAVTYTVGTSGATSYQWFRNGVIVSGATSPTLTLSNAQAAQSGQYTVLVSNPLGAVSSVPVSLAVAQADTSPPTAPAGFNYADLSSTSVTLIWRASSDNVGVVGYCVYRDGQLLGTTGELAFTDSGLAPNNSYTYTVKAIDGTGNFSSPATIWIYPRQDFAADSDRDGLPDVTEAALGTNGGSAATGDGTNQTQLNFHRPIK